MQKGFTIIEIIIAVFVLTIGIIGVFSAFYVIVFLSQDSVDRFTATYLSQEGIEIARNIRDTNWLNYGNNNTPTEVNAWDQFLADRAGGSNDFFWQADYRTAPVFDEAFNLQWYNNENYLKIFGTEGFYEYRNCDSENPDCETKFKRKITASILNQHSIRVLSEVSWDKKATLLEREKFAGDCGPLNCIKTEEILYDWY
ncbi:MAG: hypothetical protein A2599_02320 [Candidatus Staskawiczbacteria bacterium RIFOXYD1_FULL_39_28]|uniref:Uncharacterized protein n=1 Tax=Candidatus Staskawiczbacteria bacterium RIFOXYC1_FULL_38_18 TaxID=1802229 RepID=A0A1G2JBE5_9BACT|nr:MAG: hypothetical protein A2401_01930 [Candidatus Staskawiczbacteria bacterium RIFOXYC1_FULL_38_18]OGZ89913.1 MAG: hypothetical protein A2599_02320 [Candidatus Staskawiczbacteria bacterium RIFOXYD1_FULL_39_28]